ncbi:MAG: hypothetical protein HY681_05250 [Chloroflexi bacterium]|nr:hypothetical protein [Chloroflexota bacterium]
MPKAIAHSHAADDSNRRPSLSTKPVTNISSHTYDRPDLHSNADPYSIPSSFTSGDGGSPPKTYA